MTIMCTNQSSVTGFKFSNSQVNTASTMMSVYISKDQWWLESVHTAEVRSGGDNPMERKKRSRDLS